MCLARRRRIRMSPSLKPSRSRLTQCSLCCSPSWKGHRYVSSFAKSLSLAHSLQSLNFSSTTTESLEKLNIRATGFLVLKHDSKKRGEIATSLGQDGLWSSANFNRQLQCLGKLIPRTACHVRFASSILLTNTWSE